MLGGICCGRSFLVGKMALWLLVWLPVVTVVCATVIFGGMILAVEEAPFFAVVVSILFMSVFFSAFLYAMCLPVLVLAGLTDCYHERLRGMVFRDLTGDSPFGQTAVVAGVPREAVNA